MKEEKEKQENEGAKKEEQLIKERDKKNQIIEELNVKLSDIQSNEVSNLIKQLEREKNDKLKLQKQIKSFQNEMVSMQRQISQQDLEISELKKVKALNIKKKCLQSLNINLEVFDKNSHKTKQTKVKKSGLQKAISITSSLNLTLNSLFSNAKENISQIVPNQYLSESSSPQNAFIPYNQRIMKSCSNYQLNKMNSNNSIVYTSINQVNCQTEETQDNFNFE